MTRELEHWRNMHNKHKAKLQHEISETDSGVAQLETQLKEVDRQMEEEKDKIRALKSSIVKNDATVTKLLQRVVQ